MGGARYLAPLIPDVKEQPQAEATQAKLQSKMRFVQFLK